MNPMKSGHVKLSLEEMKLVILGLIIVLILRNVWIHANLLSGLENAALYLMLFLILAIFGVMVSLESGKILCNVPLSAR